MAGIMSLKTNRRLQCRVDDAVMKNIALVDRLDCVRQRNPGQCLSLPDEKFAQATMRWAIVQTHTVERGIAFGRIQMRLRTLLTHDVEVVRFPGTGCRIDQADD
ncbi:hypothetical protein DYGSA30_32710 [Dyella sp. GSA-30]|nr:hypothetical protein DYGSA30_32710 [Dyella sp. GSA-30]